MVIGSLILFSHSSPPLEINIGLIAGVTVFIAAFVIFVIGAVVRGQMRKVVTGAEGLAGKVGIAQTKLDPKGKWVTSIPSVFVTASMSLPATILKVMT